jgi:flagellar biosynthesis/type III secretory pathway M-ring protein FliF/YscJ
MNKDSERPNIKTADNRKDSQQDNQKDVIKSRGVRPNSFEEVAKWAYTTQEVKKETGWSYMTIFFIIIAILILIFIIYFFFFRKSDKKRKKAEEEESSTTEYTTEELDLEDPNNNVLSEMKKTEKQIPISKLNSSKKNNLRSESKLPNVKQDDIKAKKKNITTKKSMGKIIHESK